MRLCSLLFALCFAVLVAGGAGAHEVRPAYLELRAIDTTTFDVLWKVPALGQTMRLRIDVVLPESCQPQGPRRVGFIADAYVERWRVACSGGLEGTTIRFDGLSAVYTDVLLRIEGYAGRADIAGRSYPHAPYFMVPAQPSFFSVLETYFRLGVHHILTGADHLMFVLALLLLVRGWRSLALAVTAFTVGHSVTLAAATLGGAGLPSAPVEAAIALSIVCAAAEALLARRGVSTFGSRLPWLMAFGFGLLHGLGFAEALRDTGLPQHAIGPALVMFNLGVEAGQTMFVAAVLVSASLIRAAIEAAVDAGATRRIAAGTTLAACYTVGIVGGFWLIERMLAVLT
jgi:hypothetical protein